MKLSPKVGWMGAIRSYIPHKRFVLSYLLLVCGEIQLGRHDRLWVSTHSLVPAVVSKPNDPLTSQWLQERHWVPAQAVRIHFRLWILRCGSWSSQRRDSERDAGATRLRGEDRLSQCGLVESLKCSNLYSQVAGACATFGPAVFRYPKWPTEPIESQLCIAFVHHRYHSFSPTIHSALF